ncbi:hypothetical protein Q765_07595 [Flavobacterium rivuli WB 3.3-2 = DSM 21788]|uniref:Uncharacterized protein n=1 Tax=Flavobacterium rivuli WB 3.3-2 = DSM 21788 TaxID=1121895 RepID=A0A0A2M344_9FLAO|nr:hypothetical protein Q765_07595 [Flavobacterium rivuli WB 3.3-2 = DSM 21788]
MGIIIYPFLIMNAILVLISIIMIIKSTLKENIEVKHCIYGFFVSFLIYSVLYIDYKFSTSAYPLGTYFMFPFFMIFIPFIIGLSTRFSKHIIGKWISKVFLYSVIFSGLFIIFFQNYTFYIIDFLGIPKHF